MENKFKFQATNEDKIDILLLEHYKRCKDFCLSYNTTIWSMPSVATAINVGTYYAIFDTNKKLDSLLILAILLILLLLNFALTIGVNRHLFFQRQFGRRLMDIEAANGLEILKLNNSGRFTKIKAGEIYIFAMIVISLINFIIFINKLICFFSEQQT